MEEENEKDDTPDINTILDKFLEDNGYWGLRFLNQCRCERGDLGSQCGGCAWLVCKVVKKTPWDTWDSAMEQARQ